MNWLALDGLPEFPSGALPAILDAGYDGVQFIQPLPHGLVEKAQRLGLGVCGSGRVNEPRNADLLAKEARDTGLECVTLHLGSGLEDDDEAARLIDAVLEASIKYGIPLYPETHRATIFQDLWRTVQHVQRFPQLRFNGDFSHWYTGCEMVYGDFQKKLEFIRPVLDRVRFLHGRIGTPGCIQVDIGDGDPQKHPYVNHFRTFWISAFLSLLHNEPEQSSICFTLELLSPVIYYARTFEGREESDRWQQSFVIAQIARECFAAARDDFQRSLVGSNAQEC
jgi:hypothetical protein